jgi:transcriptional regulator with XRE-family HTH domain
LADRVEVPHQQIHKYERAHNRIAAGRLHRIAQALEVDVGYFFAGLSESGNVEQAELTTRTLELARLFTNVRDIRQREALAAIARAMAQVEPEAMAEDDAPG